MVVDRCAKKDYAYGQMMRPESVKPLFIYRDTDLHYGGSQHVNQQSKGQNNS
jgi:hypothetical protein